MSGRIQEEKHAKEVTNSTKSEAMPFFGSYTTELEKLILSYLTPTNIAILKELCSQNPISAPFVSAIGSAYTLTHPPAPERKAPNYAEAIPDLIDTLQQISKVFLSQEALRRVDLAPPDYVELPECKIPSRAFYHSDQAYYQRIYEDNLSVLVAAVFLFGKKWFYHAYRPQIKVFNYNYPKSTTPSLPVTAEEQNLTDRSIAHLCLADSRRAGGALRAILNNIIFNERNLFVINSFIRHGADLGPTFLDTTSLLLYVVSIRPPITLLKLLMAHGADKAHLQYDPPLFNPLITIFRFHYFQTYKHEEDALIACFDKESLLQPAEEELQRRLKHPFPERDIEQDCMIYLNLIVHSERLQYKMNIDKNYWKKALELAKFYVDVSVDQLSKRYESWGFSVIITFFTKTLDLIQACSFLYRVEPRQLSRRGMFGSDERCVDSYPTTTILILEQLQEFAWMLYDSITLENLDKHWAALSKTYPADKEPPTDREQQHLAARRDICRTLLAFPIFNQEHFRYGVSDKYFDHLTHEKANLEKHELVKSGHKSCDEKEQKAVIFR